MTKNAENAENTENAENDENDENDENAESWQNEMLTRSYEVKFCQTLVVIVSKLFLLRRH